MFLRALCGSSPFNDSFCGSRKVNVFKLTVIELWTGLWGFLNFFPSYYTTFSCYYLPSKLFTLLCRVLKPSLPHPFSSRSYDPPPPGAVIYNAIGLTIIRLHTISPRPRSPAGFYGRHFCLPRNTLSSHTRKTCKAEDGLPKQTMQRQANWTFP